MNCRDCSHYRAHPDDARRAGRCGLHGRRTGPGGSCIDFRDPFAHVLDGLLDRLRAEGCDPRLIPGPHGPRLLVRLSRDPLLNRCVSRYRCALIVHLAGSFLAGCSTGDADRDISLATGAGQFLSQYRQGNHQLQRFS